MIDEADLLLSYGYGEDITSIGQALPGSVHTLLLSATITPELKSVTSLFLHNPGEAHTQVARKPHASRTQVARASRTRPLCPRVTPSLCLHVSHPLVSICFGAVTIDLEEAQSSAEGKLSQFWLRCSHSDKFLVMYALFKLNRIPGRSLIFVNSVDRGFRLKLFLEQAKSLNSAHSHSASLHSHSPHSHSPHSHSACFSAAMLFAAAAFSLGNLTRHLFFSRLLSRQSHAPSLCPAFSLLQSHAPILCPWSHRFSLSLL